jgi:pyroglutamyl-peptidase
MRRAYITGFGPFPGVRHNPSGVLAARLGRSGLARRLGWALESVEFPTGYGIVGERIAALATKNPAPEFVLMLGVAARAKGLRVELRARNRVSATYRDASGRRPGSRRLEAGAEVTRFGRHQGAALAGALRNAGVPARVSRDTGSYVCNFAYWRMLKAMPRETSVLFVHIPLPARAGVRKRDPRPSLARMEAALKALTLRLMTRAKLV